MNCIFALDVGGTNIKIGKFVQKDPNEPKKYEQELDYYIKTIISDDYHDLINQIISEIDSNLNDDTLYGIGIGVPGPVVNGVLNKAQNINWDVVNVEEEFKKKYPNTIIEVLNDANAATLGEWYYGSEIRVPNMIFVTLGTGVGGGIIVNGELIEGATGSAGEIGHIKIFPFNGRECSCGLNGCVEQYASGTGMVKTAYGMMHNGRTILSNKKRINARNIFEGAEEGDQICLDIVDKTCFYLAIALANLANSINPNRIVIGGGLSKSGDLLLDGIRKHFKELAFYSVKDTEIVLASLYNNAGIMGCLYQVLHSKKGC